MSCVGQTTGGQLEQQNGYQGTGNAVEEGSERDGVIKLKKFTGIKWNQLAQHKVNCKSREAFVQHWT